MEQSIFSKKRLITIIIISVLCAVLLETMFLVSFFKGTKNTWQVNFLIQGAKEEWRKPLVELLSKMDTHGSYIETKPEEEYQGDRYDYFPEGYGVALFDFNLDGIPEVIEMYPGGSGGLSGGTIFDLYSGTELGWISGNEGDWSVYYNTETLHYEVIGTCGINFGLDNPQRFVWMQHSYNVFVRSAI